MRIAGYRKDDIPKKMFIPRTLKRAEIIYTEAMAIIDGKKIKAGTQHPVILAVGHRIKTKCFLCDANIDKQGREDELKNILKKATEAFKGDSTFKQLSEEVKLKLAVESYSYGMMCDECRDIADSLEIGQIFEVDIAKKISVLSPGGPNLQQHKNNIVAKYNEFKGSLSSFGGAVGFAITPDVNEAILQSNIPKNLDLQTIKLPPFPHVMFSFITPFILPVQSTVWEEEKEVRIGAVAFIPISMDALLRYSWIIDEKLKQRILEEQNNQWIEARVISGSAHNSFGFVFNPNMYPYVFTMAGDKKLLFSDILGDLPNEYTDKNLYYASQMKFQLAMEILFYINSPNVTFEKHEGTGKTQLAAAAGKIKKPEPYYFCMVHPPKILENLSDEERKHIRHGFNYQFDVRGHVRRYRHPRYVTMRGEEQWIRPFRKGVGLVYIPKQYILPKFAGTVVK